MLALLLPFGGIVGPSLDLVGAESSPPMVKKQVASQFFHVNSSSEDAPPRVKRTFLGVESGKVEPALTAQLGLPEGHGLIVQAVVPDSAAVKVLAQHDVLLRFEDQILIEPSQLGVLVQGKKAGDTVTLTILRGGKEQKVSVTLTEREVSRAPVWFDREHQPVAIARGVNIEILQDGDATRVLRELNLEKEPGGRRFIFQGTGPNAEDRDSRRVIELNDDDGSATLTEIKDSKLLVVKDPAGKVLFDGAVSTPEEKAALPKIATQRLEQMENLPVPPVPPVPPVAPIGGADAPKRVFETKPQTRADTREWTEKRVEFIAPDGRASGAI